MNRLEQLKVIASHDHLFGGTVEELLTDLGSLLEVEPVANDPILDGHWCSICKGYRPIGGETKHTNDCTWYTLNKKWLGETK